MAGGRLKIRTANKTTIGFVFAFILLLLGNVFSFIATQKVNVQSHSVNHTNLVIDGLDDILSFTSLSESSLRGYLISEDENNYDEYLTSKAQTDSAVSIVRNLTTDNIGHQEKIAGIQNDVEEIQGLLEKSFLDFKNKKVITSEVKNSTILISEKIAHLKSEVTQMQSDEKKIWDDRSKNITNYIRIIKVLGIITTLIAVILTIYSIIVFNKENKAKKKADKQADSFREQLQKRVVELDDLNKELIELRGMEKFAATGRIARTMAHEIRNPLTNINLATEQLKSEFEGSEDADMFLEMIDRNSVRINKLVSDLLHATRPAEIKKIPVSINKLLQECLKDAGDRIQLNHVKIIKDFAPHICNVAVDVDKIKIAFLNLIVNGIEAMEEGGTLTVSTSEEQGKCVVKIIDTGKGMTKEHLDRLFEPFFTTKKNGNGLGLANTRNVILSHNGNITCDSTVDKGTMFTVSLDFV